MCDGQVSLWFLTCRVRLLEKLVSKSVQCMRGADPYLILLSISVMFGIHFEVYPSGVQLSRNQPPGQKKVTFCIYYLQPRAKSMHLGINSLLQPSWLSNFHAFSICFNIDCSFLYIQEPTLCLGLIGCSVSMHLGSNSPLQPYWLFSLHAFRIKLSASALLAVQFPCIQDQSICFNVIDCSFLYIQEPTLHSSLIGCSFPMHLGTSFLLQPY